MPVYVYKNLRTGETFEVEQRISEPALTAHPESGDPVKRLVQPVGIAFRGSGFYVTDSRQGSAGGAKPGGAKPDGAAADGAKSDAAKGEAAKGEGAKGEAATREKGSTTSPSKD